MVKYLIILLFCSFQSFGVKKYAVLIGIGPYPKEIETTLNGDKDLDLMQKTLKGIGFEQKNIISLKNQEATKAQILDSLNKIYRLLQKGDILVFYFSGHGKQIIDDDIDTKKGTKEEADGYDEAIVCYDGKYLIDDEIHNILLQIQNKIGEQGQVVTFFDCCYSGTMSRDLQVFSNQDSFEEFKNTNNQAPNNLYFFSAVTASGKSQQSTKVGLFTKALSEAFRYPLKTYSDLFARIQEEITKTPNAPNSYYLLPTFEGNGNALLFGHGELKSVFFYEIQEIDKDSMSIVINGGKLSGIFENSEISVFPIGTHSVKDAMPLYKGVVTLSENLNAKVSFKKKIQLHNLKSYWVFITKPSFEDYKVTIAVEKKDSIGLAELFKDYSLLKLTTKVEGSTFSLRTDEKENTLVDNNDLKEIKSDKNIKSVLSVAQQFARVSILKKVESVDNPEYRISMELIPVSKNNVDLRDSLSKILYIKQNTPTFDTTMRVILKITNTGNKDCYFSVLNISSNSEVQTVLPSYDTRRLDLWLKKGDFFLSEEILGFTLPFGNEILIGFASKKPLNLFPIINNTWTQDRANDSPLNTLLNDVYSGTRSPQNLELKKLEGSIYKYYYRIIPKTN